MNTAYSLKRVISDLLLTMLSLETFLDHRDREVLPYPAEVGFISTYGVNAQKDVVNAEKEGDADVNEEFEDIFEEETFTQWIETTVERVSKPRAVQSVNVLCPQTPQRVVTRPSSKKRVVKPSFYLTSPYMNKKTKVISLIKKFEFVLGNSLFAMQGDKL
ncbi:hypothetical protein Tco_0807340 [Tanacetum coccineum]